MSWLGTIEHNGWRMDIQPDLSTQDWERLALNLDMTWSEGLGNYSPVIAKRLIQEMFPNRTTKISYGKIARQPLIGDGLL